MRFASDVSVALISRGLVPCENTSRVMLELFCLKGKPPLALID